MYAKGNAENGPTKGGPCLDFYGISPEYRCQLVANYQTSHLEFRTRDGDKHTWNPWMQITTAAALEEMRQALKLEIYAELATLNAGFVVPVVIPDNE